MWIGVFTLWGTEITRCRSARSARSRLFRAHPLTPRPLSFYPRAPGKVVSVPADSAANVQPPPPQEKQQPTEEEEVEPAGVPLFQSSVYGTSSLGEGTDTAAPFAVLETVTRVRSTPRRPWTSSP